MTFPTINTLRKKAENLAAESPRPDFYRDKEREIKSSEYLAERSELVSIAKSRIKEKGGVLGHGFKHAHKVAIESAAIIFCELGINDGSTALAEKCLVAGYLHDIKRDEENHPEKAALYVEKLLTEKLLKKDLSMIAFAIRNHEAFKEHEKIADKNTMLMSGALYDADKFRWGPDNFLHTIWDMAESLNLNCELIINNYKKGIEKIEKIKNTFRTGTGKIYGPDFIDKGLAIGERLYRYCKNEC